MRALSGGQIGMDVERYLSDASPTSPQRHSIPTPPTYMSSTATIVV